MTFSDYQKQALTTYIVNPKNTSKEELARIVLGVVGESGEIAEKIKKFLRQDNDLTDLKDLLVKEIGDVVWYLAVLSHILGVDFETVAQVNIEKLAKRNQEKKIFGDGDER